ncbi:hypothetical protein KR067_013576, partial [Drosophila pandora]
TMDSKLFVFAFVLATCNWQVQPVQGNIPHILGFVLGCSADETGSLCAGCERVCGEDANIKCVRICSPGCICKSGWIRKDADCVKMDECSGLES